MFCVNCGLKLGGRFCAGCGTPAAGTALAVVEPVEEPLVAILVGDWRQEVRYDVLLQFPEVRRRLAEVPEAAKSMSAEEWMTIYDKIFKEYSGGVSVQTIAKIAGPIYAKMGLKTGKKHSRFFDAPPGQVIVDVLCALARNGLPLVKVHQGECGCVIEAKMPSDLWAMEGQVVVTIEGSGDETTVEAATNIPGQLFDWGKSSRCLEKLFGDLRARAA